MSAAAGATLDRPHVWLPGSTVAPLLLLHGTGGDEHDLLPLRDRLAPGAAALAPRGTVLENGLPRFFRRLREGVFDEDDLHERVAEMAEFLSAAGEAHAVSSGTWIAVGFSNGANMASAMLFDRPELLGGAVLFAAMVPFRADPVSADLTDRRVAVSNGRRDPLATPGGDRVAGVAVAAGRCRGGGVPARRRSHGRRAVDPRHPSVRRRPRVGLLVWAVCI